MPHTTAIDEKTGRKFYVDDPDDLRPGEDVTFILSLHGGGSVGGWQRLYFPAQDYKEKYRLVITTPSAATKEPMRRWTAEADDDHLRNVVDYVFAKYGLEHIRSFWLAGHSQGGMTSNRLLGQDYFKDRVDGWLSLSGGRIGPVEHGPSFLPPGRVRSMPNLGPDTPRPGRATPPESDLSFIFTSGEHELVALPETSPWAEKYHAGARQRLPDIVDSEPGQVYDTTREGNSTPGWGLLPRPGSAVAYVYPGADGDRVIADVVRLDKGHTEGLEPNVTDALIAMIVSAPGGKARRLAKG